MENGTATRKMPGWVHTPACHCVDCDARRAAVPAMGDNENARSTTGRAA